MLGYCYCFLPLSEIKDSPWFLVVSLIYLLIGSLTHVARVISPVSALSEHQLSWLPTSWSHLFMAVFGHYYLGTALRTI